MLGTGTDVGKTWVASALIRELQGQGYRVAARKPAQSFHPGERTDAEVLAATTGETPTAVCPSHRWYEMPMAPPMAADALGRPPFSIAELAAETVWPAAIDVGIVEGAGGVRSPLASDGDGVDLAAALRPDCVILVAEPALGTLNAVRLSIDALPDAAVVVYLNRFDEDNDLHCRNRKWILDRMSARATTNLAELRAAVIVDGR